ncbi:MAG: ribosome silencing factor [Phycisphaerae bacterium]|nr:ribosome silencing factor [Phycisphaerae bacterium]
MARKASASGRKRPAGAASVTRGGTAVAARPARRGVVSPRLPIAKAFAVDLARMAGDDRCEDVLVLDLHELSAVCDFFVIATGTSDRQMRAVADHMEKMAASRGERPFTRSGLEGTSWIVLDFVDVVVHLFDAAHRQYYELESLWGDAPRVAW